MFFFIFSRSKACFLVSFYKFPPPKINNRIQNLKKKLQDKRGEWNICDAQDFHRISSILVLAGIRRRSSLIYSNIMVISLRATLEIRKEDMWKKGDRSGHFILKRGISFLDVENPHERTKVALRLCIQIMKIGCSKGVEPPCCIQRFGCHLRLTGSRKPASGTLQIQFYYVRNCWWSSVMFLFLMINYQRRGSEFGTMESGSGAVPLQNQRIRSPG